MKKETNWLYEKIAAHVGHEIEVVTYGRDEDVNVSIECVDCDEVLYDVDKYDI